MHNKEHSMVDLKEHNHRDWEIELEWTTNADRKNKS